MLIMPQIWHSRILFSIFYHNVCHVSELKDLPVEKEKTTEDDYEDLTDSDDLAEDVDTLHVSASRASIKSEPNPSSRLSLSKRKKSLLLHDKPSTRKKFWTMKFRGKLPMSKKTHYASESKLASGTVESDNLWVCPYNSSSSDDRDAALLGNRTVAVPVSNVAHLLPSSSGSDTNKVKDTPEGAVGSSSTVRPLTRMNEPLPFIPNFNTLYPINDIDDQLIRQRRFEMEYGVMEKEGPEEVWVRSSPQQSKNNCDSSQENETKGQYPSYGAMGLLSSDSLASSQLGLSLESNRLACSTLSLNSNPFVAALPRLQGVHTQVDYKHHLVPDMEKIVNSSFYWGVMDRYEAEKLIENKPEGTFLLRDSAQDEFLFSVSFRRYWRSLHARIEQWNHKFSFDSRDPGVFSTDSVCGLIEHYKDPSCCMFFEPMLTLPLHRNFPFSLQHLARATISSRVTYDGISQLPLPETLKEYLRFYHYKQKVRVRRFDNVSY